MRFATEEDVDKLIHFLGRAELNGKTVNEIYPQFMLMEDEFGSIQATIGYERVEKSGLLRSLAVTPMIHQLKFVQFFQTFLVYISQQGIQEFFLLTDKEESLPLFHSFGFQLVDKEDVPMDIQELEHFKININKQGTYILCSRI